MDRIQKASIVRDLEKKMVLLAGPRQVGKTTLSKDIGRLYKQSIYLNYDSREDRRIIESEAWLPSAELLILDEIHKMPQWKSFLKGVYDTKASHLRILVTGSAKLDIYRQAGDSLAGRYFLHHLLPLSLAELKQVNATCNIDRLLERGGFPEPYLAESTVDAERWRLQYVDSVFREEVLAMENIHGLRAMQLVFELLRERVGSPISYKSIAEDVGASPNTVKKYIEIFEALYLLFRVTPYSKNIARSLLKEPKIYFFDTGLVKGDEGCKLENLFAVSLLKETFFWIDTQAKRYKLQYLRTKEKKEVDFALVHDGIEKIIEVKLSDPNIDDSLIYFHNKYGIPAIQAVKNLKHEYKQGEIEIRKASSFLESLSL